MAFSCRPGLPCPGLLVSLHLGVAVFEEVMPTDCLTILPVLDLHRAYRKFGRVPNRTVNRKNARGAPSTSSMPNSSSCFVKPERRSGPGREADTAGQCPMGKPPAV